MNLVLSRQVKDELHDLLRRTRAERERADDKITNATSFASKKRWREERDQKQRDCETLACVLGAIGERTR